MIHGTRNWEHKFSWTRARKRLHDFRAKRLIPRSTWLHGVLVLEPKQSIILTYMLSRVQTKRAKMCDSCTAQGCCEADLILGDPRIRMCVSCYSRQQSTTAADPQPQQLTGQKKCRRPATTIINKSKESKFATSKSKESKFATSKVKKELIRTTDLNLWVHMPRDPKFRLSDSTFGPGPGTGFRPKRELRSEAKYCTVW